MIEPEDMHSDVSEDYMSQLDHKLRELQPKRIKRRNEEIGRNDTFKLISLLLIIL
jgi:hypothetical protein